MSSTSNGQEDTSQHCQKDGSKRKRESENKKGDEANERRPKRKPRCVCSCADLETIVRLPEEAVFRLDPDEEGVRCRCRLCGNGRCALMLTIFSAFVFDGLCGECRPIN